MLPDDTSRPLVFVAGGIGITVFRSMLRYVAEEHLPYRVTLIYSNRDRESTAFLDELVELERELAGFRLGLTRTDDPGWDGESRKIDGQFFEEYTKAAMTDSNRIPESFVALLKAEFSEPELVELTFLIGYINMLNLFNNCLQVSYNGEYALLATAAPATA